MKRNERIETIFDEMVNLTGARLSKNNHLAERRESLDELDGLYLPGIDEIDPEDDWIGGQCRRYHWHPSEAL